MWELCVDISCVKSEEETYHCRNGTLMAMRKSSNRAFMRLHFIALTVLAALLSLNAGSWAADPAGSPRFGVVAGYHQPVGYFDSYLSSGYGAGLIVLYPLPFFPLPVLAEMGLTYSRFEMDESPDSALDIYSLRAGGRLHHRFHRFFQPYGGAHLRASVVNFSADRTGEEETVFKPAVAVTAGLCFELALGFNLDIGVEYASMPLSGEAFQSAGLVAAVTFNYGAFSRGPVSREDGYDSERSIRDLLDRARAALADKNTALAKAPLSRVLEIDAGHEEARDLKAKIEGAERSLGEARTLVESRKMVEAIPALADAALFMREAEVELGRVRNLLRRDIPTLESAGIACYEKKQYRDCINLMKKILLIDPDNQKAKLYLPRAERRHRAIETLK